MSPMPEPRRPHANEEGPTLLFQRTAAPAEQQCIGCPFRQVTPDIRATTPRHDAAVLPVPPLTGPGATPRPTAQPAAVPTSRNAAQPGALPRPSLLAIADRGDATLVLPDALKPAGPEAATVARPVQPATTAASGGAPRPGRRDAYDELASPDITIMQVAAAPAVRAPPRRKPARPGPDARAYFLLNLCLGLLIVAGLAVLVTRDVSTPPAGDDHAAR